MLREQVCVRLKVWVLLFVLLEVYPECPVLDEGLGAELLEGEDEIMVLIYYLSLSLTYPSFTQVSCPFFHLIPHTSLSSLPPSLPHLTTLTPTTPQPLKLTGHLWGRSPVWTLSWRCRCDTCENFCPQVKHMYGCSLLCSL